MFCVSVLVIVLLMSFKNYKNIKIMFFIYLLSILVLYGGFLLYALHNTKESQRYDYLSQESDLPVIFYD
jgi:predicted RND superfamily exporter protein